MHRKKDLNHTRSMKYFSGNKITIYTHSIEKCLIHKICLLGGWLGKWKHTQLKCQILYKGFLLVCLLDILVVPV